MPNILSSTMVRLSAALIFSSQVQAVAAESTLIYAGQLLAVPGRQVLQEQSILITDGEITWIKPGYIEDADVDKTLDLKNSFVMPGLMDMHVHMQFEIGPKNDSENLRMSDEEIAMRSIHFGKKTLLAGFTTVRDVGSKEQQMYALRKAEQEGWVDSPRIVAAGGVGITGGHSDVSGMKHDLLEIYTSKLICDGPYDCRRAARYAIKFGGDLIKVSATGGVLTDRATGTGQQMAADELTEIVQAAAAMGKKVAAHAHQEDGIIAALKAGVASIEHGSYASDEAFKLFKKTGAYLVPTLLAGDTVVHMAKESDFLSEEIKTKAIKVGGDMKGNFAKAYKAGVKIAFGTDSGVSRHGINAQEAVLMHEAGMSAMDILKSATVNAADLIDQSDYLGSLAPGKAADIIATHGSPLADIKELLDVDFVMKGGKIYKQQ